MFLDLWVPEIEHLSEAKLRLNITQESNEDGDKWPQPASFEAPVERFPHVVVRRYDKYGGGLQPGVADLIFDYMIYSQFFDHGKYNLNVEALLPDGRILFSFGWEWEI